jgi:L-alanine-DL-glutamate epimerase-like enolase superfamily enzyme
MITRRKFAQLGASAAVLASCSRIRAAADTGPLSHHRIAALTTRTVPLPWPRHVGRNAKRDIHGRGPTVTAAILETDQGAVGWGELPGGIKAADKLRPALLGRTVAVLFDPASGILDPDLHPLDHALHDLAGVILGQPVWKMLGAIQPRLYPIYSGMIYFDDLDPAERPAGIDQVLKNCAADHALGYRQLKLKIGRGNKWMPSAAGLQRDIEVTRTVARAFPDCELLVDGNDGFTPETIIAYLQGIEGIPLFWIEEPFVDHDANWRQVHAWTRSHGRASTLLADGEQNNDFPVLEKLEADGILQVRLCDIASYGFTRWRALMPRLVRTKTLASPHAWGSGLKTVYAAHLLGGLGNGASVEGVTCSHEHVDFGENRIRNGQLQLSTQPGFGLKLRPG